MSRVNIENGMPVFTEADFMQGRPEEILEATQSPKILVMWPHGDETLGARIGSHLYNERPDLLDHVDYMCGNPRAAGQEPAIRYTETDLNRSFNPNGEPQTYEEKRAAKILGQIAAAGYDYVLDVHTSTTDVGSFFLANHRNPAVDAMIAASPLTRTVMMPDSIAQAGLIGQVPHSVSIEYNRDEALERGVEESIVLIEGLIKGVSNVRAREREFFYVTRPIPKTEDPGLGAKNFELCADGYYPVLFGENTYRKDPTKPYLGFAATEYETAVL